jgi:hypothetical protein
LPIPTHVHLGPLLKAIAEGARWQAEDSFPAYQGAADATERVLSFACAQGQWDRYLPRLRGYVNEREGALGEIWTAQLLSLRGASIVAWEPERVPGLPGDLEVEWPGTPPVFVETKCPQWKGELSQVERRGARGKLPKYLQAEARSLDPTKQVLYVAREALPTLPADQPTLLVAVDNLFMSPVEMPLNIVDHLVQRGFSDPEFSKLGGIWFVYLRPTDDGIEPRTHFIANNRANKLCGLPETVRRALSSAHPT